MVKSILPQPGVMSTGIGGPFAPPMPSSAMAAPTPVTSSASDSSEIDRTLLVFRRITAPLLSAVAAQRPAEADAEPPDPQRMAEIFSGLVDTTIALSHGIAERLNFGANNAAAHWLTASATADIVAASYRALGKPLDVEETTPLLAAIEGALQQGLQQFGFTRETLDTDPTPPLGHVFKALAPVTSAVARFSFGRDQQELLLEITERLMTIAGGITHRLNKSTNPDILYYSILDVAGEFYMEAHFAEMDRLLEMPPEERKEYVRTHDKKIPMEPVWEMLELKLSMLEAVTHHLQEQSA